VKNQQPVTVFPIPLNFQKSWAYPTLIPENGWIMAFVMPYKEFYKDLKLLLFRMVAVSFLVALLIFYLVFAISRRVMQPISKISRELHTFSIEKLDPGSGQNNETVLLQDSLERLRNQYEKNLQSEKEIRQRRERLRADMQLAAEIQASFIPPSGNHFLHDAGLSLHAVYKPMLMVSGDLFDFFMISDHKMLITIGDVSGDGIPAALFMGVAHTHIKSHAFDGDSKDIVGKVNKLLCKNNTNQFFLSLFLGILDLESDTLNYCNAGHTPTFLVQQTGRVKELGDPHGLPLGLYPDRGYKDNNVKFSKGDLLILYTDGLSEQINEAGDFFGTDNFYRVFDKVKNHSSEEVAAMILHEVNHFAGASAQSDDLSLLVLKYQ
jgi:sigma-B regulation protein RsbU (phosphoserine phosphatase)